MKVTARSLATAFECLIGEAKAAGFSIIADSDSMAIRIMRKRVAEGEDLRQSGVVVKVHGGCGGGGALSGGSTSNYGNR